MIDLISVDLLDPSPTQPRKHFNEKEHESLTGSMREHGFAFGSLLVRPKPDNRFEIVIGERRTRAARAAGIATVPCSVDATLTDVRVMELQLVENLQRDDLNPLEEAEGYQQALALRDSNDAPLHTIDSLAARINKDRDRIDRLLKLCQLTGEAREWVMSERLPETTAALIGALPTVELREQAAQAILHPELEPGPLSYRAAEELISKQFARDLRKAPFDKSDPQLVPERSDEKQRRCFGGACTDCPFYIVSGGGRSAGRRVERCANPPCFDAKIEAEWERWQASETDAAKKRRALSREESRAVFSTEFPTQPAWNSGLVNLDQFPASDELKAGEESSMPWRELVGAAELEVIIGRDINGKPHEMIDRKMAIAAAQLNGHDFFKSVERADKGKQTRAEIGLAAPSELAEGDREEWLNNPASREEVSEQRKKEEKAKTEAEERARLVSNACFDALRKKAKPAREFLRRILLFVVASRATHEELLKRYKLPVTESLDRNIAKWRESELTAFLAEFIVTDGGYNFELDDENRAWLKQLGVDVSATEKRIAKPASAAEKKAPAIASKRTRTTSKPSPRRRAGKLQKAA